MTANQETVDSRTKTQRASKKTPRFINLMENEKLDRKEKLNYVCCVVADVNKSHILKSSAH